MTAKALAPSLPSHRTEDEVGRHSVLAPLTTQHYGKGASSTGPGHPAAGERAEESAPSRAFQTHLELGGGAAAPRLGVLRALLSPTLQPLVLGPTITTFLAPFIKPFLAPGMRVWEYRVGGDNWSLERVSHGVRNAPAPINLYLPNRPRNPFPCPRRLASSTPMWPRPV